MKRPESRESPALTFVSFAYPHSRNQMIRLAGDGADYVAETSLSRFVTSYLPPFLPGYHRNS